MDAAPSLEEGGLFVFGLLPNSDRRMSESLERAGERKEQGEISLDVSSILSSKMAL